MAFINKFRLQTNKHESQINDLGQHNMHSIL